MLNMPYANEIRFKASYGCYSEWSEHVMERELNNFSNYMWVLIKAVYKYGVSNE